MTLPLISTILYIDSEEGLEGCLDNLQKQERFLEQCQLIAIDPNCSEEAAALLAELPNAVYVPAEGAEVAEAYQMGLEKAQGRYLHFFLSSAALGATAYSVTTDVMEQNGSASVSMVPMQRDRDTGTTRYKGACMPQEREDVVSVDLTQSDCIQLMLQAYVFRTELAKELHFHTELRDDAQYRFLLEFQLAHPVYDYARRVRCYYTVSREDNTSTNPLQYLSWWYQSSVDSFHIPFLAEVQEKYGSVPTFVQLACYYLIYCKYNCNMNDRSKGVIKTKEEAIALMESTFRACTYLDPEVMLRYRLTNKMTASRVLRFFLLRGRAKAMGRGYEVVEKDEHFVCRYPALDGSDRDDCPETVFAATKKEKLRIRIMNHNKDTLQVDASVGLVDLMPRDQYEIYAVVTEGSKTTVYPAQDLNIYPLIKYFGFTITRKHNFQFLFPVPTGKEEVSIQFFYRFNGNEHPFHVTFITPNSHIVGRNRLGYWLFGDRILTRRGKRKVVILPYSRIFHIKRELLYCREAWSKTKKKKQARRGVFLRMLFWLLRGFYQKKHIWVTFDKQYKAGDNGEYIYQYLRENAPDVEPYYIIKRESPDYPRLVKQDRKHILVYGTIRCQLICLLAEIYLGTHANISAQYNRSKNYRPYTVDLQQGDYVCIQHGLTIQKIAQYQNRQFDNIRLYCLASPFEQKNLSHPFYDFKPEELRMTGLARYDGLKNNDQKIILITPTWRKNVVNSNVANNKKTHNSNFKNSAYFRIYNDLINDPTLIDCAKRCGYRIIYLLHPAMSAQLEDFDRNDFVELLPATGDMSYEKILTESSLMVTDYSGVQFDFAYMRKCLVYYHPDELPPHYDAGGLIYETMGFGPICRNHQQIVSELCAAMERQCTTEPEYVRRADEFFAFSDHNNCERIYHTIKEWKKNKG